MILIDAEKEFIFSMIYGIEVKIRFGLSNSCHMFIFADDDPELDFYALKHLTDYFERFYLKKAVLVSEKIKKLPDWEELQALNIRLVNMSSKKINMLKTVSQIHGMYIQTIAFDCPEEKKLINLTGVKGITKEDILCVAEYQLFNYEKIPYVY